jgi:tetratricopeptide (TPR) repeat protein
VFGTDEHATIATTLSNIGQVLFNHGKYAEALDHLNKSLEIDRKVFGTDEHATIATTLSNIGLVLKNQRKTVHIKGERTMDPWTATCKHSANRGKLNDLYAAQSFLIGRDLETVRKQHGDWHTENSLNKTIEHYEQVIRTS